LTETQFYEVKQMTWSELIIPPMVANLPLAGVAVWAIVVAKRTLDAIACQGATMQKQADAMINSERAWLVAELTPICKRFGGQWHRPSGTGWAPLSAEEILGGAHLKHKLRLTNMGRTPATILKFELGHSFVEGDGTDLVWEDALKGMELPDTDEVLAASSSTDVMEIDISQLVRNLIMEIGDSKKSIVFHGSLEYLHVFDDAAIEKARFRYVYTPSAHRLDRLAMPKRAKAS
jgi:hypothetical protein